MNSVCDPRLATFVLPFSIHTEPSIITFRFVLRDDSGFTFTNIFKNEALVILCQLRGLFCVKIPFSLNLQFQLKGILTRMQVPRDPWLRTVHEALAPVNFRLRQVITRHTSPWTSGCASFHEALHSSVQLLEHVCDLHDGQPQLLVSDLAVQHEAHSLRLLAALYRLHNHSFIVFCFAITLWSKQL